MSAATVKCDYILKVKLHKNPISTRHGSDPLVFCFVGSFCSDAVAEVSQVEMSGHPGIIREHFFKIAFQLCVGVFLDSACVGSGPL